MRNLLSAGAFWRETWEPTVKGREVGPPYKRGDGLLSARTPSCSESADPRPGQTISRGITKNDYFDFFLMLIIVTPSQGTYYGQSTSKML
jgi:hypothetical protein